MAKKLMETVRNEVAAQGGTTTFNDRKMTLTVTPKGKKTVVHNVILECGSYYVDVA